VAAGRNDDQGPPFAPPLDRAKSVLADALAESIYQMQREIADGPTTEAQDKIRFSQLAAYGAGGIIPIALFNVAGILVGLLGNISLGLSAFWLGAILIVPRLWDALADPVIGHLSDNTRTRWGRRRPYLLLGGLAVAVSFVVIWWIPKGDLVHSWFPTAAGYQVFQVVSHVA